MFENGDNLYKKLFIKYLIDKKRLKFQSFLLQPHSTPLFNCIHDISCRCIENVFLETKFVKNINFQ